MFDGILKQVKEAILGGNDAQGDRNVRPASEDSHGDPADVGEFGNVRPASEDSYGDPGNSGSFGNVRPASEDPYGDPADH